MKKCNTCNEEKDLSSFRIKNGYVCNSCRTCQSRKAKKVLKNRIKMSGVVPDYFRFGRVKNRIKHRGYEFSLTKEEWKNLIKQPCHYCERPLDIKSGSGLDRKDDNKHYTKDNVVPCCYECNMIKGRWLNYEEAKIVLSVLKSYRDSKK